MNVVEGTIDADGDVRDRRRSTGTACGSEAGPTRGRRRARPSSACAPRELRLADAGGPGRLPGEVLAAEAGTRQTVVIARVGGQVMRIATRERMRDQSFGGDLDRLV